MVNHITGETVPFGSWEPLYTAIHEGWVELETPAFPYGPKEAVTLK
jgi:hypothetical protein